MELAEANQRVAAAASTPLRPNSSTEKFSGHQSTLSLSIYPEYFLWNSFIYFSSCFYFGKSECFAASSPGEPFSAILSIKSFPLSFSPPNSCVKYLELFWFDVFRYRSPVIIRWQTSHSIVSLCRYVRTITHPLSRSDGKHTSVPRCRSFFSYPNINRSYPDPYPCCCCCCCCHSRSRSCSIPSRFRPSSFLCLFFRFAANSRLQHLSRIRFAFAFSFLAASPCSLSLSIWFDAHTYSVSLIICQHDGNPEAIASSTKPVVFVRRCELVRIHWKE